MATVGINEFKNGMKLIINKQNIMKQTSLLSLAKPKSYLILIGWAFLIVFGGKFVIKDALPYFGFDPEVFGRFLWNVSRVYINQDEEVTYRIQQNEVIYTPEGKFKERRQRERAEANVDSDIPLSWTGKKIDKNEAIRRYVFSSKLQIVHINGLTYDFLYGMAKELSELNSLMLLGGGKSGKEPLVFRRGSTPYRGFLEGRVKDDSYILLLHLSNAELKSPE
jgi:hypothetical protein